MLQRRAATTDSSSALAWRAAGAVREMATDYGKWDRIAAEIEADERAEGSARDAQAAAALRQEATARVAAKAPAGDASGAASPGATSNPRGDCDGAAAGAAANTRAGESGPMPTVTDAMIDDMVGRLGLDVKRRKAPARREAREARGRGGPRCDDDGAGGASESKGGGDDDVIEVTGGAGAKVRRAAMHRLTGATRWSAAREQACCMQW